MMGQPLDGVLNQAQRNTLEIVDFIFHIIDPEAPGKGNKARRGSAAR